MLELLLLLLKLLDKIGIVLLRFDNMQQPLNSCIVRLLKQLVKTFTKPKDFSQKIEILFNQLIQIYVLRKPHYLGWEWGCVVSRDF